MDYTPDVLRLRYGTENPTCMMQPYFSLTCVAKFLGLTQRRADLMERAYFRKLKNIDKEPKGLTSECENWIINPQTLRMMAPYSLVERVKMIN